MGGLGWERGGRGAGAGAGAGTGTGAGVAGDVCGGEEGRLFT